MLKRILAVVLVSTVFNSIEAANAASPASLLSQQCLRYQIDLDNFSQQGIAGQAVGLERQLIGLFNLNDNVNYYRYNTDPRDKQSKELLLNCQLKLADKFTEVTANAKIQQLTKQLQQSQVNEQRQLGQRLAKLVANSLSEQDKARNHVLEASITHALRQRNLSLILGDSQCDLASSTTESSKPETFKGSIANYLIKQQDQHCRQEVWQAYQLRAKDKNQQYLSAYLAEKQLLAKEQHFTDYASYSLAEQYLSTPELVEQFLDAITRPTTVPWDLGLTLEQANKTTVEPISSQLMLDNIGEQLKNFGLRIETITPHILRVWHEQRLLGELFIGEQHKIKASKIRQIVVGHQFGQVFLGYPDELTDYQAQKLFIEQFAQTISQLVKGGRYYLLNNVGDTIDSSLVGQYWLTEYLIQQLLTPLSPNSREAYLYQYAEQQKVFRSKLALHFYQGKLGQQTAVQEFKHSFSQTWPQAADAIYSFNGIVNEGPLYYHSLWQKTLAKLIYQSQKCCQNQRQVFEILLINEEQLPFSSQLNYIFGETVSPTILINRIQYDHFSLRL